MCFFTKNVALHTHAKLHDNQANLANENRAPFIATQIKITNAYTQIKILKKHYMPFIFPTQICTLPIPTFCKFVKFNRKQSKFNLHHIESSQQRGNKESKKCVSGLSAYHGNKGKGGEGTN